MVGQNVSDGSVLLFGGRIVEASPFYNGKAVLELSGSKTALPLYRVFEKTRDLSSYLITLTVSKLPSASFLRMMLIPFLRVAFLMPSAV